MNILQDLMAGLTQSISGTLIVEIVVIVIAAWLLGLALSWVLPRLFVGRARRNLSAARRETLFKLIGGATHALVYMIAILMILSLFFPGGNVLTALGLISAGVAFAARPFCQFRFNVAHYFDLKTSAKSPTDSGKRTSTRMRLRASDSAALYAPACPAKLASLSP